jgi:iron complex outermembrane receptor protein
MSGRFFIFFVSLYIVANIPLLADQNDMQHLLNRYNKKNDLSQKTIDENKGHLILYTREKLESMHARTLKDVFKTAPVVYYHENRYSLPDPLTSGSFEPYRSSFIRIYIDGVEVTEGWMGSGLMIYGDINIDFVDHIEFYYMIPSFETSVEPAYLTIFLYSKDPKRDSGSKLNLSAGSHGYNTQTFSYRERKEDLSYMVNVSHTEGKRERIDNGTSTPLSRDYDRLQLFSYIKTEDQMFHLQVIQKRTDALAGLSLDATPEMSQVNYTNVHMDYRIDFHNFWRAQFAYDWLKTDIDQIDDNPMYFLNTLLGTSFHSVTKNSTYSGELTYRNRIGDHRIAAGIKGRIKRLDSIDVEEEVSEEVLDFDKESVVTLFFQDQYVLSDKELVTFGIEYNHIFRNGDVDEDDLLQIRLGYIYTDEHWSYKTYLYRLMFATDPLSRFYDMEHFKNIPVQKTIGMTHEVGYAKDDYTVRLMLLYMQDEDGLLQNGGEGNTKYFFSVLTSSYMFDINNKLDMTAYYAYYKDLITIDDLTDISAYVSFQNRYGVLDFYNGIVYHQNSIDYTNYFDWTSTVTWNISENMTLTLKGDNLLNKAKKTDLYRIDISSGTPVLMAPLKISPIDRRVTLELEYTF